MNINLPKKGGKPESGLDVTKKVVVAVKASKEIPRAALVWALTHVVQPGDCITLLVVVPSHSSGKRLWVFPRFAGDCASGHRRSHSGTTLEQKSDITDSCSQMMLQLHDVYDPNKINVKIKVIPGSPSGAVAAESKRAQASWVLLDRQLKQEKKRRVEELQCNIVTMKRSQPKIIRLNLIGSPKGEPEVVSSIPPTLEEAYTRPTKDSHESLPSIRGLVVTPTSSPKQGTVFTTTEAGTSSVSSSDPGMSPFLVSDLNGGMKKADSNITVEAQKLDPTSSDSDNENLSPPSTSLDFQPWMAEIFLGGHHSSKYAQDSSPRQKDKAQTSTTKVLLAEFSKLKQEAGIGMLNYRQDLEFNGNVREKIIEIN